MENYNILFAEFIGRRGKLNKNLFTWKGIYDLIGDMWVREEDLKFNTDENWLKFVTDKIESINTPVFKLKYHTEIYDVLVDAGVKNAKFSFEIVHDENGMGKLTFYVYSTSHESLGKIKISESCLLEKTKFQLTQSACYVFIHLYNNLNKIS